MATTDMAPAADPGTGSRPPVTVGERDILFNCDNCQGELVVDREGAGLSVPCPHCGHPVTIPDYQRPPPTLGTVEPSSAPPAPAAAEVVRHFDFDDKPREHLERRFNELKHQLKENRSQDTEMRGHVNRATMELHRLPVETQETSGAAGRHRRGDQCPGRLAGQRHRLMDHPLAAVTSSAGTSPAAVARARVSPRSLRRSTAR